MDSKILTFQPRKMGALHNYQGRSQGENNKDAQSSL